MLLSDEEVEQYITKISTRRSIKSIGNQLITFKYPDNILKLKADSLYEFEYNKAIDEGFASRASLEKLIEERNLFSKEDQKELDSLKSKLEAQQILLAKTTVVKANQDRIKDVIHRLNEGIRKLLYKKNSMLSMSAEVKANEERSLYLCWASTYNDEDALFWKSLKNFKNHSDIKFRDKVLGGFFDFYSGISTKQIRFIARHNLWRIRYVNSQKLSEPLFGVPSVDYSSDMLNLAYWSNYYDNIFQMMPEDRPSDLVIDDDMSLDAYMKAFYEERTRQDAARRVKRKSVGKLSAFDSEEVIVTASNELYQDIKYDKPKEAQKLKERSDIKKRTSHG